MENNKPKLYMSLLYTGLLYLMIVYIPHSLRVLTRSITHKQYLTDTTSILIMLISYLLIFGLIAFYVKIKSINISELIMLEKGNVKENSILTLAVSVTGLLLIMVLTLIITQGLSSPLGVNNGTTMNHNTNNVWLEIYLYPLIIAPICEEIIHRGVNHSFFKAEGIFNIRSILYILTSSFVFGFIHYSGPIGLAQEITSVLTPFLLGVTFSIIYLKTKNICYPIVAHILYNIYVTFLV